jgi:hypothetical protein
LGRDRDLQSLSSPLIGENRHISIILRFTIINKKEATSVVESKLIIVCGPAEFRNTEIAVPVVLARTVQDKIRSLKIVITWN